MGAHGPAYLPESLLGPDRTRGVVVPVAGELLLHFAPYCRLLGEVEVTGPSSSQPFFCRVALCPPSPPPTPWIFIFSNRGTAAVALLGLFAPSLNPPPPWVLPSSLAGAPLFVWGVGQGLAATTPRALVARSGCRPAVRPTEPTAPPWVRATRPATRPRPCPWRPRTGTRRTGVGTTRTTRTTAAAAARAQARVQGCTTLTARACCATTCKSGAPCPVPRAPCPALARAAAEAAAVQCAARATQSRWPLGAPSTPTPDTRPCAPVQPRDGVAVRAGVCVPAAPGCPTQPAARRAGRTPLSSARRRRRGARTAWSTGTKTRRGFR